uniref:Uncharacterized protein n=1 Tax=Pyrodinium bahamense TaxID=73915 RepID=A0A7S0ALJ3_9DINO|mmetsp:Transcript_37245/g.103638  ORF Transcript_37245/g.103638 Transcript_37245/m.103638 type:complete len:275 (+) Transcript_37245:127-951(+)
MMPVTNSLRVTFPESEAPLSMAPVCRELSRFGEVARLEMPPDGQLSAVVSYYDVRAATRAREGLGDRCTLEPEYGDRIVVSHGDVQVSAWMIQEIRTVQREGSGGKYTLEFFDTRAAERAASCLFAHAGTVSAKVAEVTPNINCSLPQPRYRNDLRLSQVTWEDLTSGREARTTLRLRCLPRHLCTEQTFQGLLARVGLSKVVDSVRVFPGDGKCPGSALVNAVDSQGVIAVAKYFHGRQWGRSLPVAVSFAAVQGAEEVRTACVTPGIVAKCQ